VSASAFRVEAFDPARVEADRLFGEEFDEDPWIIFHGTSTLNKDTSRAFEKPKSGRIAVKVINHLGDEVMKVFRV